MKNLDELQNGNYKINQDLMFNQLVFEVKSNQCYMINLTERLIRLGTGSENEHDKLIEKVVEKYMEKIPTENTYSMMLADTQINQLILKQCLYKLLQIEYKLNADFSDPQIEFKKIIKAEENKAERFFTNTIIELYRKS